MRTEAPSWQAGGSGLPGQQSTSIGEAHSWLADPKIVLGLIGLYLLGHFVLRLLLGPTLGIDDAEQILFAQQWAPNYRFRQPPLFTWLLMPVIDLVGPAVVAVSIVRYGLLAITYVFLYLTARRCIRDQRLAALAVLSYSLIYVFAYYAHHDLTHTTALGAMIALTYYVALRLIERPSIACYLLLGLCFGLGMLAKWNFAMLALGLPLTCLAIRGHRHLVLSWKTALAIAVAAAVVLPTGLWMIEHGQSIRGMSDTILAAEEPLGRLALMAEGIKALLTSTVVFPLPFLILFLAFFGRSLLRAVSQHDMMQKPPAGNADAAFFGWLMVIILALHLLLIPTFGAVNFTERWMHPALMILPVCLFALVERGRPEGRAITFYLALIAILVAVVAGTRLYRHATSADQCSGCREFAPFVELAADLRAAGFTRGTIIADGLHMGGNLKMLFPDSRVIDPAFPMALWPAIDDERANGMCLLAWRDDQDDAPARRALISDFAISQLGVSPTAPRRTGQGDALLYGSSTRRYVLGFELIEENAGGCR